jgi:hypothetical protein
VTLWIARSSTWIGDTGRPYPMPSRTIAFGDIHACSAVLDALLDAIKPRPKDSIVIPGDHITRGPYPLGVLDG